RYRKIGRLVVTYGAQALVERVIVRHEEVQQPQPVVVGSVHPCKGIDLVAQQLERDTRVFEWVVARVREELVALDQSVIRVGRESQRRPFERIDGGKI